MAGLDAVAAGHTSEPEVCAAAPGIFDLADHSMRYTAGFCFVVGFLMSVLVRIGVVLAEGHFSQATPWSGF